MSARPVIAHNAENGEVLFDCPGCRCTHRIFVRAGPHPCWGYNGDPVKPTFKPSIAVSGHNFTPKGRADYDAWVEAGMPKPAPASFESAPTVCHSFVTDGQIQFLSDCTHGLAGQTVPLPEWD